MTFNVRYPARDDINEDQWENRWPAVMETIKKYQPDFLGSQEVVEKYKPYFEEHVPEYAYFGRQREPEGHSSNESNLIFYLKDRWEVVENDSGTFQLSYTPDVIGSGGRTAGAQNADWHDTWEELEEWGHDARIVTWGLFREKATGMTLYVYNTHWDNQGTDFDDTDHLPAILSAQKILSRKDTTAPVIYMGDLNARQGDHGVEYLLGNEEASDSKLGEGPPIEMLDTDPGLRKIDHIFIMPTDVEIIEAGRKEDLWDVPGYSDIRASDHWPTSGEFKFWHDTAHVGNVDLHRNRQNNPSHPKIQIKNGRFTVSIPYFDDWDGYSAVYNFKGQRYYIQEGNLIMDHGLQ